MSRRTVISLAAVGLGVALVAGCASSTVAGQPTFDRSADGRPPTKAELRTTLLTEDDLPAGFAVDSIDSDEEDGVIQERNCRWIFEDDSTDPDEVAVAEATFSRGTTLLMQDATSYRNAEVVAQGFAVGVGELDECDTFTERMPDGSVNTYRMSMMDFPEQGERSMAMRMSFTREGLTVDMKMVLFQVNTCLGTVITGGLGTPDSDLLEQSAHISAERLEAVC